MTAPAYYPAWFSTTPATAAPALKWGPRFDGPPRTPLHDYVYPMSARRIVGHWLDLLVVCGAETQDMS